MSENMIQNNNRNLHIPVLALRGIAVFPNVIFHFDVARVKSVRALEQAMAEGQRIFLVSQRDVRVDDPGRSDLYDVGTLAKIRQILRVSPDSLRVLVEGECRARLDCITQTEPCLRSDITEIPQPGRPAENKRDKALIRNIRELFMEYSDLAPQMTGDIVANVMENNDISQMADFIAQNIQLELEDKQRILEQIDPRKRLLLLTKILMQEIDILALEIEIHSKVKDQIDKNQRDYYLREQARAINEELGEGDDPVAESQQYMDRIRDLKLDLQSEEKLLKEADRLSKMQYASAESGVIRTYLDTCLELPWNKVTKENNDIKRAAVILDTDHFGLEKVKERILELFAVKSLGTQGLKGQIICLAGPPGVGKTSVARSIARCMGRNYARLSLGGVRDEADIRGHRKTYIGAMPGRIMTALRQAGSKNCLILIDEIDKLGNDYKGDPSSAMLEVLDTEQNMAFRDHYIELPFDLSDVLFITTANDVNRIPDPLLDRMEVIELPGYTDVEKVMIAKKHLLPKQLKKHGLRSVNMPVSEEALQVVIDQYTRESGVRSLERELGRLCRKTAKMMVETGRKSLKITPDNVGAFLGTPKYKREKLDMMPENGVVNGLAWTSAGGEMLEVEVMAVDGTGKLELTGNLGDVMKESAKAAITYIRSRTEALGIAPDFYSKKDLHIHFPEGAVPKDGPSAGITMVTAIISALTGRPVSKTIAMTGEVTLRGRVLPIGGLREKTMAAYRIGVKTVILPEENRADLDDIDRTVKAGLRFIPVSHMDQVIDTVFEKTSNPRQENLCIPAMLLPRETALPGIRQ